MARIWALVKDPGGFNSVLPVVQELKKDGHTILLLLYGNSKRMIEDYPKDRRSGIGLYFIDSQQEFFSDECRDSPKAELLVTSTCADGMGPNLVSFFSQHKLPTVAVQDFWGGGLKDFEPTGACPAHVIVNDSIDERLILKAWPGYERERVKVSGYPSLDRYASFSAEKTSREVKEKLGMMPKRPVILLAGQGDGTGHLVSEVVKALNAIDSGSFYFIPRPHPRTQDDFCDQILPWQKALAELNKGGLIVDFFKQVDTPSLIAASDVVLSMFSTVLIEAAVLRKQCIAVLFPEHGQGVFQKCSHGLMEEFPLVELGCCRKAASQIELRVLLNRALSSGLDLSSRQEAVFRTDGQNARRAADFINTLL